MLGLLMKTVRNRRIKKRFLALKDGITELVHTRRIRETLLAQKFRIQKRIYAKSVEIRQSSLKKDISGILRNTKSQTKLTIGLAFRNATRSRYRSFLLIFGILITIALETGIIISVDTLYDDFIFDHRNQNFTDITVRPRDWIELEELRNLTERVRKVPGVLKASPVYYISADQFLDVEISDNVLVYGIDQDSHPDFAHLDVVQGDREVSGYTVMISESIQAAANAEIGTPIPISSNYSNYANLSVTEVTVGGVITDEPYIGNKLLNSFILVDIEILYNAIPENQSQLVLRSEIDVCVNNLLRIKQISENIKDEVGIDNYVFVEKAISEIQATGILAYQTAMNLVILASFLVEFLFITNVLAIAIKDRSKEFGILRAVGINSRQLIMLIAVEILIYALIGSIFGIIVGIGLSTLLVGIIDAFYLGIEIQVISIQPLSLMAAFLSGIFVSLISGLYPIFLALNTPVVQNIHSQMRTAKKYEISSNWKYSVGAGIFLSIIGFLLQFFVGPTRFLDFSVLSVHFFVIVLIFIGTVLLEVGILVFLPKIGMKVLFYFGIVTRTISMRNIAREFQKSLFTILTTALALAFIIVTGLTSAAVIASVPSYFQSQWGNIDLIVETRDTNPLGINFTDQLEARFSIVRTSFIQEVRTEIGGINGYVFGVDPYRYEFFAEQVIDSHYIEPTHMLLNETTRTTFNTTSGELETRNITHGLITHRLYQRLFPQVPLGSDITLKTAMNETVDVSLSVIIKGNVFLNDGDYLYISSAQFQNFFDSELAKWFLCDVDGIAESTQVALENSYPELKDVLAITFYTELIEESLAFQTIIFQVLFIESLILAAMAQFVCILISTLRMEREMGIIRGLGLHKQTIFSIFLSESTALGLSAVIIGVIDGLIGSILLAWYISQSIPVSIQFPLDRVLLWVIFSFTVTLASTILPSYRSSQKNIIATISGRPMTKMYIQKPVRPFLPFESHPGSPQLIEHYAYPSDKISLRSFVRDKQVQIQTIFLILLAIVTMNYILDANIIIRGLIPSDVIWREFFGRIFLSLEIAYNPGVDTTFLIINPILLIVGLATIGPISFYLAHEKIPNNLIKSIIKSVVLGVVCLILCTILIILIVFLDIFILSQIAVEGRDVELSLVPGIVLSLLHLILVLIIGAIIFQRIWAFLVFQGSNPSISLKDQIKWIRKTAPKGQFGFILLLFLHILFQAVIFTFTLPSEDEFFLSPQSVSSDPILFLILAVFEVGFFLLLIVYQIVQFKSQQGLFLEVSP